MLVTGARQGGIDRVISIGSTYEQGRHLIKRKALMLVPARTALYIQRQVALPGRLSKKELNFEPAQIELQAG